MKKTVLILIFFTLTAGYVKAQINHTFCEKLFYAVQSSADEFSYARGTLRYETSGEKSLFRVLDYELKPSFMENTDFIEGGISVSFDKRPVIEKPVKKVELKMRTASLGEIKGGGRDSALVNRFLSMGGAVSNCFTGGTVEQIQLDSIEQFTKFLKYVLYSKNVLNEKKLVEDSLCINNPYIEISLNRLTVPNGYEAYFAVKIIHMSDL